ncbi:MAG: 4-hydroxy-tetrahydrodipicolinate synthase [Verrucomicrobiota bacterium]|jgi:4-hydroxy-tetrahydrodipicolinate synthase
MSNTALSAPLSGIIPPLVTPLKDRDALDEAGLDRVIEHCLGGGVAGLFLLGTTGEGPSLGYRVRRELIERACKQVRHRVPVLVGITDTAFVESVNVARQAADAGADALVLAPPYYMPEGQPELREYLEHLLPELPLPLFLYNMPPLTKVPYEVETVRWAIDQPGIVGIKDSSGSMGYFNRIREAAAKRPDWTLLTGPEELLAEAVLLGGHGGVCGGANIFPRLYVELHAAAQRADLARVRRLHSLVMRVSEELYHVGHHPSSVIRGIKCALACIGVCDDFMAEPFRRFRAPERKRVEQAMERLRAELSAAEVGGTEMHQLAQLGVHPLGCPNSVSQQGKTP